MVGLRSGRTKFGKELDQARMEAGIQDLLDWRTIYKSPKLTGPTLIDGESAYVVEYQDSSKSVVKTYFSAKTYLLVRRETEAAVERFGDFRKVGALTFPFEHKLTAVGTGATHCKEESQTGSDSDAVVIVLCFDGATPADAEFLLTYEE
mgnify:CR=1 FL=1